MEKNSQQNDSANPVQKSHARRSNTWGVFHVLKYQNWHNQIKKKLPHKRPASSKHAKGDGDLEDVTSVPQPDKAPEHKNSGKNKSAVDGKIAHTPSGSKTSVRSRLKSLMLDELTKRKSRHPRSTARLEGPLGDVKVNDGSPKNADNKYSSAGGPLDPSIAKSHGDQNIEEGNPIFAENHSEYSQVNEIGKQIIENPSPLQENSDNAHAVDFYMAASVPQSKEISTAFDLINTNRELFLKIFQDQGSQLANHFHNQQAFGSKMRFYGKSMSFPARSPSLTRGPAPSNLKLKEKIESPDRDVKLQESGFQTQKPVEVKAKRYNQSSSMSSVAAQYREEKMLKLNQDMPETPESSSSGSAPHLKNRRHNQVVIRRFKNMTRKIKHANKKIKWEKPRIALDSIVHKIPHGHKLYKDLEKETANPTSREGSEITQSDDTSISSTRKSDKHSMSGTSSLLQSLDKYCRLYDSTFNKEAKDSNIETSMSRSEGAVSHRLRASKSMGRNFSLPYRKSCLYQGETEGSSDGFPGTIRSSDHGEQVDDSKVHAESVVSDNFDNEPNLFTLNELRTASTSNSEADWTSGFGNLVTGNVASQCIQDVWPPSKSITELEGPSSAPAPRRKFLEAATIHPSLSFSNGRELSFKDLMIAEKPEEELLLELSIGAPSVVDEIELPSEDLKNEIVQLQVNAKDKAKFDYVSYILELSGFSGTESLKSWQSEEQPLDPSMFEEVAGRMLLDSEDQDDNDICYQLLLFDLINEILMEIYVKSYSYWPMPLSSLAQIHPMPVGHEVLEEVWTSISWYLSTRPDSDNLLHHLMSRDLMNDYGWMNLQFDSEFAALQLEDLIFNQLLEEAIWRTLL